MAEDKLTLASLRKALALKTGCTEEIAGTFLTSLFPAIVTGLKEDKQVRINGLGTFKLQWNEPRKSVNIRTGESIIIDGYNKVIFVPETSLKEQINEPFAHLEPVYIDGNAPEPTPAPFDPMQKFSEQAEEIKDLLSELGGFQETNIEETPTPEEAIAEEKEEVIEEIVEEEQAEELPSITEELEVPIVTEEVEVTEEPATQEDEKKPFNAWLVAGITILVFAILLTIGFFVVRNKIVSWADSLLDKSQATEVMIETPELPTEDITIPTDTTDIVTTPKEEVEPVIETPAEAVEDTPRVYTEFIKSEKLTNGSRLTWLSRKYYGAPDFWVYIYEANQDKLPDPNTISVGTTIRIPKLPAEWIDTTNAESMQRAKELHEKILR